jgi:hypothetical protein
VPKDCYQSCRSRHNSLEHTRVETHLISLTISTLFDQLTRFDRLLQAQHEVLAALGVPRGGPRPIRPV